MYKRQAGNSAIDAYATLGGLKKSVYTFGSSVYGYYPSEIDVYKRQVIAYTEDGLECATELTVAPDYVPAPSFTDVYKRQPYSRIGLGYLS